MAKTSTSSDLTLTVRRAFDAPRDRVFRAWTDATELKQWFAPGELAVPRAEVDLRVGGRFRIAMAPADGDAWIVTGTYREIRAPERLVFSWQWAQPTEMDPGETLVTVEFLARGAGTEVVLTHERLVSDEERRKHQEGWTGCLENLATVLA